MRKTIFDKRLARCTIVLHQVKELDESGRKEDALHLVKESKVDRQFRGLINDIIWRKTGHRAGMIARNPAGDV